MYLHAKRRRQQGKYQKISIILIFLVSLLIFAHEQDFFHAVDAWGGDKGHSDTFLRQQLTVNSLMKLISAAADSCLKIEEKLKTNKQTARLLLKRREQNYTKKLHMTSY